VRQKSPFLTPVWCLVGYSTVAQPAPSAKLEVVGQVTVQTEAELTAEGHQVIRGRVNDEVGAPVSGTLHIRTPSGRPANVQVCPWLPPESQLPPRKQLESPGTIPVALDGTFCFIAEEAKGLVLVTHAEHFLETVHDLDLGLERSLTSPTFVEAPATLDLHQNESHVVQILARSERRPPDGARLALSLECDVPHLLGESSLAESRVQRFEFKTPVEAKPGSCRFVATASAPHDKPLRATRSVLLRDRVQLTLAEERHDDEFVAVEVKVTGQARAKQRAPLDEGLIEAREGGAFVGLGPVRGGTASLEFKAGHAPRVIELTYVPASSAYLPGEPLALHLPALRSGFRWAGAHTLGLLAFCIWLGYAWLRPRDGKERGAGAAPPKRALLRESGKRTGPISGRVLDAHTGAPLAQIEIELRLVGALESRLLEQTRTNAAGEFHLETHLESHALLSLTARGDRYMTLSSPTRGAEVTVHLTERRRALVQALVAWARKSGRLWDRKPAPTPLTIERTARQHGDDTTAEWAQKVSRAAYGAEPPSELTARDLLAPGAPTESTSSTERDA
jgi:hypothetical protein